MLNHKLKILIILSFFTTTHALGQSFKTDWKNFKAPINWQIDFVNNNESYLAKLTQGELVFKNQVDTNLKISYHVFLDFQVDPIFLKEIASSNFIASCVGANKFQSFNLNGFRYLPNPCNTCLISTVGARIVNAKNKDGKPMNNCELLSFEISKFTTNKQQ